MYFIEFYKKYVISIIISNLKKEKRKKKETATLFMMNSWNQNKFIAIMCVMRTVF